MARQGAPPPPAQVYAGPATQLKYAVEIQMPRATRLLGGCCAALR